MEVRLLYTLLFDTLKDIVYFPFWWYTSGAKRVLLGCFRWIVDASHQLAPGLWAKNILVPMYGQTDWQGRLMSFFMRLVNVIGRSIGIFLWSIVVLFVFALWLALPFIIIMMVIIPLAS